MIVFNPLFDLVLVSLAKEESITKGGIVIPDSHRQKPDEGTIKAIGSDVKRVKVGDKVVFGKYVGTTLSLEETRGLLLLHESDLLGILTEEKK